MNERDDTVRIRPIEELDIEDISAIDERIGGSYRPAVWERRVFYYIRRDAEGSFVAETDGRVVGFMLGEMRSGDFGMERATGWIEVLGVDPDYRQRSIGRLLADAMLQHFRERGAVEVRTLVDESMPEIERFFAALGFEPSRLKPLVLPLSGEAGGEAEAAAH